MSEEAANAPLRAGVVGLGWAGQQHMAGYHALDGVELVGLAGMEEHLLAELGKRYDVPGRYASLEAMLAEANLDVLSIATPTAMHAPMAIAALGAGVHVLCEKPMAPTAAEAERMVEAAQRADRVLEITFNKRHRAPARTLRRLVADGVLGRVYYAKAGWVRRKGIPGLGTWFTRKESAGGGPMMDIGIHALDLALHVLGEPGVRTVSAATYAEFGPRGRGGGSYGVGARTAEDTTVYEVEDLGTALLRLDNDATLMLEASWAQFVDHDRFYLELFGTEGGARIEVEGPDAPQIHVTTDVDGIPANLVPDMLPDAGHEANVADFVELVRSGSDNARGQVGLLRTHVIDACYASADQGREVTL
ncbi:Gfo/Idh/MocA family oxidoreductase [Ruania alkalisoli]|uniref:Gfo/Idh/MocA family oxidoreductase n=1 Tax=Ruania alkalisoli TaxID=2779775 RepID=A0A7M1SVM4_9MICO|nr:Gfo/Idh/MocA family oxidoreductase [Ruania alkalisoli]QOR71619.1 Gfo/Idh/MocA family oxidoreductase [Ruania alkalisoli]